MVSQVDFLWLLQNFSALKKMTGGLILAALAFVICALVQIQIQVFFFENRKFNVFVHTESSVFYQTKVVYKHVISINEPNSNVT